MSKDKKVDKYDGEIVLLDVLHKICNYADADSLLNISKVCKSWRCAAFQEDSRRCYIRQMCLPWRNKDLGNKLNLTPFVSLLAFEWSLEQLSMSMVTDERRYIFPKYFEADFLDRFDKQLPNQKIALCVEKFRTTDHVKFPGTGQEHVAKPKFNCDVLGLFIPSGKRQVDVRIASFQNQEPAYLELERTLNNNAIVERLTEDLGLNDCGYNKSTILMLAAENASKTELNIVRELCKRVQQQGHEITFGSIFGRKLLSTTEINDRLSLSLNNRTTVLLRIGGPSVVSWSTFIHCGAESSVIERKLLDLKERVTPKRYTIGLIYSGDNEEHWIFRDYVDNPNSSCNVLMCCLKRVFPHIRFAGFFMERYILISREYPERLDGCDIFNDEKFFHCLRIHTSVDLLLLAREERARRSWLKRSPKQLSAMAVKEEK